MSGTGFSPSLTGLPMPFPYLGTFVTSRAPARSSKRFLQPPVGNGVHLDTDVSLGSSPFARRYSGNLS